MSGTSQEGSPKPHLETDLPNCGPFPNDEKPNSDRDSLLPCDHPDGQSDTRSVSPVGMEEIKEPSLVTENSELPPSGPEPWSLGLRDLL